jgi:hypothetical protein
MTSVALMRAAAACPGLSCISRADLGVMIDSAFFQDGKSDRQKQNFVTPGLLMGRFRLWGRVGLRVGGGYQIATTHFHTTNHNGILPIRFPF